MKKTAIFLAPGFEEGEALTVADILRRAGIGCDLVGFSPVVEGAHQMKVQCDRVLDDIQKSRDRIESELGHPVTFFAYPFGVDEPDAQALIESLFPVTVMTFRGTADLSDGLRKLPRYTITMKKPPSAYL